MKPPTLAEQDREHVERLCRKLVCFVTDLLLDEFKPRTLARARLKCEAALRYVLTEALRVDKGKA